MKYQKEVTKIIKDLIGSNEFNTKIKLKDNLADYGIDSRTFIRIVIEIEDLFGINFPDDNLILINTGTLQQLCKTLIKIKG